MSRVFLSAATGAAIHVFTDDHCPPHVHARHRGEGWIARVGFSYLTDAVALLSLAPLRNIPLPRVANRLLDECHERLACCRRSWWTALRTTCLDNQWAKVSPAGAILLLPRRAPGARQIGGATYHPDTDRVRVVFRDGTTLERGGQT